MTAWLRYIHPDRCALCDVTGPLPYGYRSMVDAQEVFEEGELFYETADGVRYVQVCGSCRQAFLAIQQLAALAKRGLG